MKIAYQDDRVRGANEADRSAFFSSIFDEIVPGDACRRFERGIKKDGMASAARNGTSPNAEDERELPRNSHEVRPHSMFSHKSTANPFFRNSRPRPWTDTT